MSTKPQNLPTSLKQVARALSRRRGVVEHVEECLHDLILGGRLQPGERIIETRIARQLGIGQPAVREALKTLEAEGLVVRQPHRGCSVIKLSPADVDHIFRLRVELEVLAVRLAMEREDSKDAMEDVLKALENTREAALARDTEKFYRRDLEFHRSLWRMAGNPYLEKALYQITVPLFAFAMIKVASHPEFDYKVAIRQHEAIIQAVASGDKKRAIQVTREILSDFWRQGHSVTK